MKTAIFQHYDINEDTYWQCFRGVKQLENETPVELAICIKDLAERWLKDCLNRQDVVDVVLKEQFLDALPEEVRIWVKERKSNTTQEAGKPTDGPGKQSCGHQLQSQVPSKNPPAY